MRKKILQIIISALLLTPVELKSQSNITIDAGTTLEIQAGADVCADTRTINGTLTGTGTWCIIPLTPAPPVPVSPANNAIGQNTTLTFLWQRSPGAVTYRFQLSTDSLFGTLIVNDSTVIDSIKTVSGLNPLTYYWWRVNAKGIGGTSAFSAVYKFKTLGYPTPVTLINPPNNAVNQPVSIQFRWNRATEQMMPFESLDDPGLSRNQEPLISGGPASSIDVISNYWFELVTDTVSMANLLRDTTLTDTTKSVSGLSNLTNYYWRVKAKNQIGWGQFSVWWKFTTIVAAPSAPILVSPPNFATGVPVPVTFIWRVSPTAASYRLQITTDSLFTTLIYNDSTITDTTKVVPLGQGQLYFWRVNAKNLGGTSPYSGVWRFTTILGPAVVNLTVIPGGFYNTGTNQLNMKDTIRVILVDSATCTKMDSAKIKIDSVTFSASLSYSLAPTGRYYIYVLHRNHIVISSRYTQNVIRGSTVGYDFTTDSAKTYGFNVIKVSTSPVRWGMIPGDANRDGYVDAIDQFIWISQNGLDGYLAADFNGDWYVDAIDQMIWIAQNGQSYAVPCELSFESVTEHQKRVPPVIKNKEVERIFSPEQNKRK